MNLKLILDTSALNCLYHLSLLEYLSLLCQEVLVPEAVEREFIHSRALLDHSEDRLAFLLEFFELNNSWFFKCNDYDSGTVTIFSNEPGIDPGEAEAFSQYQHRGAEHTLILDERQARKYADQRQFTKKGVLILLAVMAIRLGVCDYNDSCQRLISELRFRLTPEIISKAYRLAQNI